MCIDNIEAQLKVIVVIPNSLAASAWRLAGDKCGTPGLMAVSAPHLLLATMDLPQAIHCLTGVAGKEGGPGGGRL